MRRRRPCCDVLLYQPTVATARCVDYGWCKGTIIGKINDRRRAIEGDTVNFLARFDIDQGRSTDLSLEASMYDTSTSADYESWLLLEEVLQEQA